MLLVCICGYLFACTGKLDLKPDVSNLIPQTVEDYQALMDGELMNESFPVYGEGAADNYYITDDRFSSMTIEDDKNVYIWNKKVFSLNSAAGDWSTAFSRISNSNLVLEGLDRLESGSGSVAYNNVRGTALFYRGAAFHALAEMFCKPYDSATARNDLGMPLRTSSDIKIIYQRASLQETYDRIIADLNMAATLLPDLPLVVSRPSKVATYSLLARVYLMIGDYEQALVNADKALQLKHDAFDYNTVDVVDGLSFKPDNNDVLFYATLTPTSLFRLNTTFVDTTLYSQFEDNDLRKKLFFRQGASGMLFVGSYSGNIFIQFGGLTVSETILTRSECYARKGDVARSMADLNTLLRNRWKVGSFSDLSATDETDALKKILSERRKELMFRGRRWSDLRRLNKDPRFAKTLSRVVKGVTYELPPNDPKYVYPIPELEIKLSGIQQNIR